MANYAVDIIAKVLGSNQVDSLAKKFQGVDAAAQKAQKGLDGAANGIRKFDREAGKASESVQQLSNGFGGLKTAIAALGLGFLAKGLLQTTSQIEQVKLGLEAFTGSTEKAEAAYQAFRHIAVESPFDTKQVASAGKTLLAFGLSAREAGEATRSLALLAGATGAPMENMAFNLGQIKTLGRATSIDLKQFAMQGIPIYQELAQVLYGTADAAQQVQEDVSKGKVSYEAVATAIANLTKAGSSYEDLSKKQLTSLQGLWATMKSAIDEVAFAIGQAFAPHIAKAMGGFVGTLEVMGKWLASNAVHIANMVAKLFEFARAVAPIAAGVWLVVKAYQAWQAISKVVAATQAFIIGLTGKGLVLVAAAGAAAAAAAYGINEGMKAANAEVERMNTEAAAAGDKWASMLENLGQVEQKTGNAAESAADLKAEAQKVDQALQKAAKSADDLATKQMATLEGQTQLLDARLQAETAINNVLLEQANRQLQAATSQSERIAAATQVYNLTIRQAQLEKLSTEASIQAAVKKAQLAVEMAALKEREIAAEVQIAQAKGIANEAHFAALAAQREAVGIAQLHLDTTVKMAVEQNRAAEAIYKGKVAAAEAAYETNTAAQAATQAAGAAGQFAANMSQAAGAAQQAASAMNSISNGSQGGQPAPGGILASFGAAGQNPYFKSELKAAFDDLNRVYGSRPGQFQRVYQSIMERFRAMADKYNAKVSSEYLSNAKKDFFADGGYVTGPTNAVIGEGGEPEYVIPASKMSAAMSNYASGKRGGSVLGNAQVNITTGPVTQMNGTDYVTKKDLVSATSSAVNQTLSMIKNDPATRRAIGVSR